MKSYNKKGNDPNGAIAGGVIVFMFSWVILAGYAIYMIGLGLAIAGIYAYTAIKSIYHWWWYRTQVKNNNITPEVRGLADRIKEYELKKQRKQ
ncbi:MAG: hypothetical protein ACOYN6_00310 [Ignavibacteria bacterium]